MPPRGDVRDRTVTVVGAGRSGLAATRLLLRHGARVRLTEQADTTALRSHLTALRREWPAAELTIECGGHTPSCLEDSTLVVTSPGVRPTAAPLQWACAAQLPMVSELELASWYCSAPIIAVTGTNGKSTVTSLLGQLLTTAGRPHVVCGNIGLPLSRAVEVLTSQHWAVVEVSSFQLEHCATFRPTVAILLNITPNHLDHHRSFEEYVAMKYRLVARQTASDWAILNSDDPLVRQAARATRASTLWFSGRQSSGSLQAVSRVAQLLGIAPEVTQQAVAQFRPLPHRQEVITVTREGIRYINDSKSTTPASLQFALEQLPGPLVLIAGGRNKGLRFEDVAVTIARLNRQSAPHPQVRCAIVLGESRDELQRLVSSLIPVTVVASLAEAVETAWQQAHAGDTVLFSPGCASFDMFHDFEDRGTQFTQLVLARAVADHVPATLAAAHG